MAIIESGVLFALALALLLGGTKQKLAIPASVILLALAWALTFSHAANWSHLDYVKSEPKSEVKTLVKTFTTYGMDEQERLIFHFAINTLEPELQKYVQAVTIVSNESYKKHESFKSSGHAHVRPGEICLLRGCDESQTIISWWHEAGHIWRWRLPAIANDEWNEISGKVYANTYYYDKTTAGDYPQNGILRLHGVANHDEDMVIYLASIYAYVHLGINEFAGVDWNAPRYLKKIEFLY